MRRPLFSFKYILQGNLYNAATSVHFQVCFARQSIQCGDLCSVSSMLYKAIYTKRRPRSVSSMFCKAIYTMRRPLFNFKYILQGNLYNAATSVQFQVCFARQSIQVQCGDLYSVSSMFCKAIYTMRRPLFSFKYVLQGNLYNKASSVQFQVCFARQSIQWGDLCSSSSMFCKAIYTMRRPLFKFKYVLQGNLNNAATSVQFQVCFAKQSIQCGDICSVQVCFARQSIQCGDLCSVSSIFCKAIYTMWQSLSSFKYVFARQSMQSSDLCSVSRIFCKAIYTMWRPLFGSSMFCKAIYTKRRPLFSSKYILQGNLYNAATSVQFQVCFARQSIQCGDLCSVQVCFARQSIQYGDLCAVSSMFCKTIYTLRRPRFCFKYVLQGNLYNVATSVLFQV